MRWLINWDNDIVNECNCVYLSVYWCFGIGVLVARWLINWDNECNCDETPFHALTHLRLPLLVSRTALSHTSMCTTS